MNESLTTWPCASVQKRQPAGIFFGFSPCFCSQHYRIWDVVLFGGGSKHLRKTYYESHFGAVATYAIPRAVGMSAWQR
jgi:hypothetical protein